jgi:hypothetical protein
LVESRVETERAMVRLATTTKPKAVETVAKAAG